MVSIEQYGKRQIQDCELEIGPGNRALVQAIVYSATAVLSRILSRIPLLESDRKDFHPTINQNENLESRVQAQL